MGELNREVSITSSSSCLSADTNLEEQLPLSLATEELQLALNKEATEEELTKAISRCKELVLSTDQCSNERKWLVRHLIEIRLRLQECKEAKVDPQHPRNKSSGVSRRVIRGHHLQLQPLLRTTSSMYCDHCTGIIWSVIQAWYMCSDCGYSCHHKCIASMNRDCAHVIASEKGTYELQICPESGLSAQKYACAECKTPLPVGSVVRRCDYNGLYYCSLCHWGSLAIIPARMVHNWDPTPKPVCQASLQQLRITANRPLLKLNKLNPKLFDLVHELDLVRRLRMELNGMRKYLLLCRRAQEDHFLWKKMEVPHLVESTDLYSLQDLVNTYNGELITELHVLSEVFSTHIKIDCEVCRGRGHICEICSNDEIVFPFESTSMICDVCGAVYHKYCRSRKNGECTKCKRKQERMNRSITDDHV